MLDAIVTDRRSAWRERALAVYREIENDAWLSPVLRERFRMQRENLENEAPLLDWEAAP